MQLVRFTMKLLINCSNSSICDSTLKQDPNIRTWGLLYWVLGIEEVMSRTSIHCGDSWRWNIITSACLMEGHFYQSPQSHCQPGLEHEYDTCLLLRLHGNYRKYSSSQTDIWLAECHDELPKPFKKKARIMSMCLKALNSPTPTPT